VGLQPENFTPVVVKPLSAVSSRCFCCGVCGWTSVPSGFVAMVSRWGADVGDPESEDGSWAPGFHCIWPWHSVDRLVSKQLIVFDAPVKACKTKDDISINIDTLVVLEIHQAFDFVYKLGPDKLDDILRAMQEEILRSLVAELGVEDIYDLQGEQTKENVEVMNEQLSEYGVRVQQFIVRNVSIPSDMARDFEDKTLYESKTLESKMKQESDQLSLDNAEALQKLREECDNTRMALEEQKLTELAQAAKEVAECSVNTEKELLLLETQRHAEQEDIRTTSALEMAKISAEIMDLRKRTAAEIEKETGQLDAEARAYEQTRQATGKMEASAKTSEGKLVLAQAEGNAIEAFAPRRAQEQEMKRLDVLERMAENKAINIVTSLENSMGLAPNNSLVTQVAQQGMEAVRMKLAEVTASSAKKVDFGQTVAGGVVRPLVRAAEQQLMS
jgi:regulator of protease activity HflC (stomatin/prohibitin superfamily)